MVAIPKQQPTFDPIQQVKQTVRIEDYAVSKMGLTPTRKTRNEWWFLCPFHKEATASFHIRLEEQDFRCFGCDAHGDVIDLEQRATNEGDVLCAARNILAEYGDGVKGYTNARYEPPKEPPTLTVVGGSLGAEAAAWLDHRGISRAVAERNGVVGEKNYIEFRYVNEGEIVNRQACTLSAKGFRFEAGKPVIPFGLDDCEGQPEVVIVEGVLDKLAVEEATGRTAVLAMPSATPNADCYALACEACKHAERVIVAVDRDDPGEKLRDELVRRVGTGVCAVVTWPEGCKDANDVLLQRGPEAVKAAIGGAVDYPVEGVFTVDDSWDSVERLYDEGLPRGASTGWAWLDRHYTVRRKQLTVITGTPGSGKSMFADALLMNLATQSWDWKFAVCSPEMQPLERHWATFVSLYTGKPFGNGPTQRLDRDELAKAREFMRDRFFMVLPEEPTLDAVIDAFLWTHRRHGVGGLLLDPWNELDHSRPSGMTETEWCNQQLRMLKRIGWQHDVAIWLVAHPTKMYRNKQDGTYPVPTLYDINGSAAFFNKADNGLVISRDKGEELKPVEVHVQKIRHQEIGGLTGASPVLLRHDKTTGRYWETRAL
ncbi:MAG: toprim domain-containing protein [Thermomicrobiales bacterium]|nr:toprim domain-containing protein [Thermomicrobiales bacterium]